MAILVKTEKSIFTVLYLKKFYRHLRNGIVKVRYGSQEERKEFGHGTD